MAGRRSRGSVRAGDAIGVGLHVDLGEWAYRDGEWRELYAVLPERSTAAVEAELLAQLERFERLVGAPPTHLDSHQHATRGGAGALRDPAAGERLGVPVRHFSMEIAYRGDFYGQDGKGAPHPEAVTAAALASLIESLPPGVS